MEKKETEFMIKLFATFKIEAEEHLKTLSHLLLTLEGELSDDKHKEYIEAIFREAHSLKGAARSVNHDSIQTICQTFENVLAAWKQERLQPSRELFDALYASIDLIEKNILASSEGSLKNKEVLSPMIERLNNLLLVNQNVSEKIEKKSKEKSKEKSDIAAVPTNSQENSKESEPIVRQSTQCQHSISSEKTIRISLPKLDKLFQQAEEMLIAKLTLGQMVNDLKNIQNHLRNWNKEWVQKQVYFQPFLIADATPLNNGFSKQFLDLSHWQQNLLKSFKDNLSRMEKIAAQDYRLISSMVDMLLEDSKKTLMQPFSTLLERLPRMVRDISHQLEKEVNLDFQGGEIEIDRRILEEMLDPLIHLIRNAIDHGIERPEERVKKNKDSHGVIRIVASQVNGNCVELMITDDGQGICTEKIKKAAIQQGILAQKDSESLNDQGSIALAFQPGISTSSIITELSGRGVGLGVVSEKVDKLGGHITVESKVNVGTTFRIILPLTLATFRGIYIKVADQDFIIPTFNVKRIIRIKSDEIKTTENRETISLDGQIISFVELVDVLELPEKEQLRKQKLYVVIIKSGEVQIAFGVDQVLNEQEVLVKGLGKQLLHVNNIMAATVMESGKVIPILNPVDLVKSAIKEKRSTRRVATHSSEENKKLKKTILLAEDSVTSRMLLKNILESSGYEVKIAVDGAEALSILKTEKVDLLLSDIEMPRMDGLTLTKNVRSLENLHDLPIILCTSLGARADVERGVEVGANAYIIKSSFEQKKLLEIIQNLL